VSLRDELQDIYDQHGALTPVLVVQAARPKGHPLHHRVFDRPPKEAAEEWYRHQARELIRSVKVVYREADGDDPAKVVRAFHAVERPDGFSYEPAEQVAADPVARQIVLRSMERDWRQLVARYEEFEEFLDMVREDVAA